MGAIIDGCYHSNGENRELGRGKAAFSGQCNIFLKNKLKEAGRKAKVFYSYVSQASQSQFCEYA